MEEKNFNSETLVYNLNVFFNENYDFAKINIFEFENILENETEILKKEYIFDSDLTVESYDPLKLNASNTTTKTDNIYIRGINLLNVNSLFSDIFPPFLIILYQNQENFTIRIFS